MPIWDEAPEEKYPPPPEETPERLARVAELFRRMEAQEASRRGDPPNVTLIGQTLAVRLAASAGVLHRAEIVAADQGFLKLRLLDDGGRGVWVPASQVIEMRELDEEG